MKKMHIKGKVKKVTRNEVVIEIPHYMTEWLQPFIGQDLGVQFGNVNRSLSQNAMLWALIAEIDETMNGMRSKDGEMAIYRNLIEEARIRTEFYSMTYVAMQEAVRRNIFRYIEVMDDIVNLDDPTLIYECRCYYGTSSFDTKEMSDFIEATLRYGKNLGINMDRYKDLYRRKGASKNE